MVMATDLSVRLGLIAPDVLQHLRETVARAGLPVAGPNWPAQRYIELMSVDKKAEQGTPKFVLLERLGAARVQKVADEPLARTLAACSA